MAVKRKVKKKNSLNIFFKLVALSLVLVLFGSIGYFLAPKLKREALIRKASTPAMHNVLPGEEFQQKLEDFAYVNKLPLSSWNKKLLNFAKNYPEAQEFVLYYPLKKDKKFEIDLSQYKDAEKMPLLMQWDERWGYQKYAGNIMGLAGCGPTSLSMVAMYLLNDPKISPDYVAEFSTKNDYSTLGNGSKWTLISEGGEKLGLNVEEIPLVEGTVMENLKKGNPIICIMGPGDFTKGGHYIVLTGVENGKITVNDCNSYINSEKTWDYSQIEPQIKNLWVCSKK